jgi:hypothetical protein
MALPTDVALRTTDYQGSLFAELHELCSGWTFAGPLEPSQSAFMFEVNLDAGEDFDAALFMAAHGWYRQGVGTLRSAIESLTIAAGFAVRQDVIQYQRWRDGQIEPKFGNAGDHLAQAESLQVAEHAVGGSGLFGLKPGGVLKTIYRGLCRYVHAYADATNGAIWESNGPVYVYEVFEAFGATYRDALAMAYLLMRVGEPTFKIPRQAWSLFDRSSGPWKDVSSSTLKQYYS